MTKAMHGQPVEIHPAEELIDRLAATERALAELLEGQADAVLTSGGRMLLLRSAQERLSHDEEVQRCAAALQRGILDGLPANIALLDRKGVIVSVNATWRQFALENGHAGRDAAVGGNYLASCDVVQGDEREQALAAAAGIRQVLSGARPKFSLEYPCHSPTVRRWFRMTATPLPDIAGGAVVMHLDVTEEKEGQQALDRMFNLSLDMLSVVGFDGSFKRVNSAFERVLGYPKAEILRRPYLSFVHPDDLERTLQAATRLAAGEDISFFENRYRCRDGTDRWFQWACRSFPSEQIIYSVTRDVTEQKQAQLALEAVQRRLVVASRQAGMAEVASNVLHNVGNVLNGVNISAELVAGIVRSSSVTNLVRVAGLLKEHAQDLPAYLATHPQGQQLPGYLQLLAEHLADERSNALRELDSLRRSIDHIKEVIASQQDHARRGGVVASVAAAEIMEDALCITATTLQLHGIRLVRNFAEPLELRTDKHQVLQILVNLLRNACDALREQAPGGRVLMAEIGRVSDERLYFVVADNGSGIAPEDMPRLFEHGFTTRESGHGFGLHSAALLAQDLGGTLAASSAGPGGGATFRLELPLEGAKRNEEP
jgi:PAS domain S-box-containing protein